MFRVFENKKWLFVFVASILAHLFFMLYLKSADSILKKPRKKAVIEVKIVVVAKDLLPKKLMPKLKPKVIEKIPKKKVKRKKAHLKKVANLKKAARSNTDKIVAPIQGLTRDSFVKKNSSGFKVAVGNSLMVADQGIRMNKVEALNTDLSADARLIPSSLLKPTYTDDALDAGLEGFFIIDVFVDDLGKVADVEIRKKIGYGMDKAILKSVATAMFVPRKDSMGKPIKGWAMIKFRLEIP